MKMQLDDNDPAQAELTSVFSAVVVDQCDALGLSLFSCVAAVASAAATVIRRRGGDVEDLGVFLKTTRDVFDAFHHVAPYAPNQVRH